MIEPGPQFNNVIEPMNMAKWQSHPKVQEWMGHFLKQHADAYKSRNADKIAAQKAADDAEMDAYYKEKGITPPSGDSNWDSIMEATKDMPEIPADAYDGQEIDVPDWLK